VVGTSASGLQQFQYVNVSNVKIWGAEARGDYRFAPEWTVRGAAAWARGEDSRTGKPVDSVDPIKLVAGLSYQNAGGFGADAVVTHAWRHDRVSDQSFFKAPIYNVTDAKYIVSQDVNGLARTSAVRDLYTQPGRYFALNATVRW
jgi:hemoglobin/transferrin/lactoferrin receptor protein